MDIFPLSEFQTIKLADFIFDVAKGAILAGLGFVFVVPAELTIKIPISVGGISFGIMSLYLGLYLVRGIER